MPKKIVIPATNDLWDDENGRFISIKEQTLVLEHSLISISKWEQKFKKPFLTSEEKTIEEVKEYIKCMTLNNVDERIYDFLPMFVYKEIDEYISDPMTATTFRNTNERANREIITSEVIYYQMISFGIPVEFEKWHLNRLIALIRIFAIKGGNQKKMSRAEAAAYQRSINERRLKGRRR